MQKKIVADFVPSCRMSH